MKASDNGLVEQITKSYGALRPRLAEGKERLVIRGPGSEAVPEFSYHESRMHRRV